MAGAELSVGGEGGVLRQEALEALAAVGVTGSRAATRMAVQGVEALATVGRSVVWPRAWVDEVLAESWADLTVPAVVVKCGPRDRRDDDVLQRPWVGVDLQVGPDHPDQVRAVQAVWPLTHEQRSCLGAVAGESDDAWVPPTRWVLVVSAGGWVPPGYVYGVQAVRHIPTAGRGRRFLFELGPASPKETAAYSGRWVPTRSLELVDLVPSQVDQTSTALLPRPDPRWLRLLDRLAGLPDGHPAMTLAEQRGWLTRPSELTDEELDELETAVTAPSEPPSRSRPAPPASTRPGSASPGHGPVFRPARPARQAQGQGRWRAPAAVLDGQQLYFDNGETVELAAPVTDYAQAAELVDTYRLGWGDPTRHAPDAGQVWLTGKTLAGMGFRDGPMPAAKQLERAAARRAAIEAGWQLGTPGGWQRVWRRDRPGGGSAMIVALPWVAADSPLSADDPQPVQLVRRLRRYAELLGVALRVGPGVTGIDLARQLAPATTVWTLGHADTSRAARGQVWMASGDAMPRDVLTGPVEVDYVWTRRSDGGEGEWVHCFDRGGSYLAALTTVYCGVGDPIYRPGPDGWSGRDIPGYWRIRRPVWGDPARPAPTDGCRVDGGDGTVWVTTPTMRRLQDEGVELEVLESWSWQERSRVFRPFYERVRDVRNSLLADPSVDGQAVLATVKATYARMIGLLDRREAGPGDRNWRPDWRHQILAQSRAGIDYTVKRLAEAGRPPVIVATDSLWIRSDSPEPEAAWPGDPNKLGRGLGQYAWQGAMRWADLAPIANRSPFNLRSALDALRAATGTEAEPGAE